MRRLRGGLALMFALVVIGFLYQLFTPAPQVAAAGSDDPAQIVAGQALYNNSCITCHGAELQGVQDRGPSLIGVGQAAVYFQVATGRMPAGGQRRTDPRARNRSSRRRRSPSSAPSSRPTAAARRSR